MNPDTLTLILKSTLQSVILNAVSNTIAQLLACYQNKTPYNIDVAQLSRFLIFAVISCPPNILWQTFLENTFPGYTAPDSPGTLDDKTSRTIAEKTAEVTKPLEEKVAATSSAINDNETVKELKKRATEGIDVAKNTIKEVDEKAQDIASNMNLPGTSQSNTKKDGPPGDAQQATATPQANAPSNKRLNVRNTVIKFALDQTFGAVFNTVFFLAGMGLLKGQSLAHVWGVVKRDTLNLMLAGQKLWPVVSVLSFTLVPLEYRTVFGGIIGIFWGIYLSLFAGDK